MMARIWNMEHKDYVSIHYIKTIYVGDTFITVTQTNDTVTSFDKKICSLDFIGDVD